MTSKTTLTITTANPLALSAEALDFAKAGKAENTKRAYKAAWADFTAFCASKGLQALPASPAAVCDYLVSLKTQRMATLQVKLAAVGFAHSLAGQADPTKTAEVKAVFAGMKRKLGKPVHKKAAIEFDDLTRMVRALPTNTLTGMRDRAILLMGFAGAFRRSELVALDVEDVRFNGAGMTVQVQHSKTDQEGQGMVKTVPNVDAEGLCPVAALRAWKEAADVHSGPLFRSIDRWGNVRAGGLTDKAIALIIKAAAEAAGLDASQFAGHSLRSGFITTAAKAGVHEWQIQEQTGHRSAQVLRDYIQAAGRGAAAAVRGAFGE